MTNKTHRVKPVTLKLQSARRSPRLGTHRDPTGAWRVGGFTLVELLIVVVILGILAAVVMPQFSTAAAEARESALHNDVQAVRSAIALYRVQHKEAYPGVTGWGQFVTQLTTKTDGDGDPGTKYGPYVRPPFPTNAASMLSSGKVVTSMPSSADDATGWIYMPVTGELRPNTSGAGPGGTDYFDL